MDAFITANPEVQLVATNRLLWFEATGQLVNTHPLHRFFLYDRLVDLEVNESSFHGSAPAAFSGATRLIGTPVPNSNPARVVSFGSRCTCQWKPPEARYGAAWNTTL